MKVGQSIDQVLQTIRRQAAMERDFIAPQSAIEFTADRSQARLKMKMANSDTYAVPNEVFLQQAHESAGIPKKYFDRCLADDPFIAALNLNHWFGKSSDNRLVRTFLDPDGGLSTARALLSPSYDRTWGHAPMAAALTLAIEELQDVRFVSCEITDRRMYIKAVLPWLEGTIEKTQARRQDAFQAGFLFRNSETGHGKGELFPFVDILSCLNGMVFTDLGGISKVHRGAEERQLGELQVNYANDTIQAKRAALTGELRDAIRTMCTMETVKQIADTINGVASVELTNPLGAVKQLASSYDLNEFEAKAVEDQFLRGGDVTRWGLVQALTAASATVESYDRASELEQLGAKIISLPATEWQVLDRAA